MLELDCHLTQDGHVVVSHDENLLRQTGHDVNISSLKLQVRGQIRPQILHILVIYTSFTQLQNSCSQSQYLLFVKMLCSSIKLDLLEPRALWQLSFLSIPKCFISDHIFVYASCICYLTLAGIASV